MPPIMMDLSNFKSLLMTFDSLVGFAFVTNKRPSFTKTPLFNFENTHIHPIRNIQITAIKMWRVLSVIIISQVDSQSGVPGGYPFWGL